MSDQPWRVRTQLIQGPPGPVGTFLSGTQAWTPPSTVTGGTASVAVTVTGAVVGMVAWAAANVVLTAGAFLWAQVTAANTVTVYMYNLSGTSYTPGALTLKVDVSET